MHQRVRVLRVADYNHRTEIYFKGDVRKLMLNNKINWQVILNYGDLSHYYIKTMQDY